VERNESIQKHNLGVPALLGAIGSAITWSIYIPTRKVTVSIVQDW
jgi:hypothetical protein